MSEAQESLQVVAALLTELGIPQKVGLTAEECVSHLVNIEAFLGERTKLNWMETRTQEVSQYHCEKCLEIFKFASDKNGTSEPPVACPMCGREAK